MRLQIIKSKILACLFKILYLILNQKKKVCVLIKKMKPVSLTVINLKRYFRLHKQFPLYTLLNPSYIVLYKACQ